jgi:hypothetical protein
MEKDDGHLHAMAHAVTLQHHLIPILAGHDMGRDMQMFLIKVAVALAIIPCTLLLTVLVRAVKGVRRRKSNDAICGHCGYSVRGLLEPRCPECGSPFAAVGICSPEFPRPEYSWEVSILYSGLVLAVGIVMLPPTLDRRWTIPAILVLGVVWGGIIHRFQGAHRGRLRAWREKSSNAFNHQRN